MIGAIILDEKFLAKVIDIIKAEDFYFADLKMCYKAILKLSRRGYPIDFVTVLNQITVKGEVMTKILCKNGFCNVRKLHQLLVI